MWPNLTTNGLSTYAPLVCGLILLSLALTKLVAPIAQLACSTFLSIIVVSAHGHSDLPIIMLSLITGTIMIGALHGTTHRVNSVAFSTTTVVALTIVAAFLLTVDQPIAGTAVYADSTTQVDAGFMHYKGVLLVSLLTLGAIELSSVSLGVANSQFRSGMASLLATTDFLLVALATGLALAPTAARTLLNRVDSDSSEPTSTTVRDSSYACGMNANSPNASSTPNTTVMNVHYTLCFVYAEILILALISAYSPEHSGLPMSSSYLLLCGILLVIANTAGNNRLAASTLTPVVALPSLSKGTTKEERGLPTALRSSTPTSLTTQPTTGLKQHGIVGVSRGLSLGLTQHTAVGGNQHRLASPASSAWSAQAASQAASLARAASWATRIRTGQTQHDSGDPQGAGSGLRFATTLDLRNTQRSPSATYLASRTTLAS
jgi:hypothetical protein